MSCRLPQAQPTQYTSRFPQPGVVAQTRHYGITYESRVDTLLHTGEMNPSAEPLLSGFEPRLSGPDRVW